MRGRSARAPDEGVRLANTVRSLFFEARVHRKVPGLFVFVAPDFARGRMRSRLLFYNLDVAKKPRRACSEPIGRAAGMVAMNSSRCSAARQRASFGTRRPQVRLLPARPDNSSVAQWKPRARGYDPRGRGFDSLLRCQSRRRSSEERMPACRAGRRGFKSRRRRQQCFRRVAQSREQLALTQQAAGSTPAAPTNRPA